MIYLQIGSDFNEALIGVGFILTIFLCVILHELGHALVARRFNIVTKSIVLLPIGGLANMERLPEKPVRELLVAIAGPIVNIMIALVLFFYLNATGSIPMFNDLLVMQEQQEIMGSEHFLFNLMLVNFVLALFNLIPAFPMDGGRILRALLGYRFDREKATNIAARVGQFLAILFVFAGFYTNVWLVFIGLFVFLGAGGEAAYEKVKSILSGYKVKDILMTKYITLLPDTTLGEATDILLNGQDKEFLVGNGNNVLGILTRNNLIKGLREFGKESLVSNSMQTDFLKLQSQMELKDAYQQMLLHKQVIGPVYDQTRLVGILDTENISELILVDQAVKNVLNTNFDEQKQ